MSNARIAIRSCTWFQGYLYEVRREDCVMHVADTFFLATSVDGKTYILTTYRQKGFCRDEEGYAHPCRNYAQDAEKFVERVEARGSIDPTRWSLYVEETAEEREAYNLKCEADERMWEGYR